MYKQDIRYKYLIICSVIFKFLIGISIIFFGFSYLYSNKFFTDAYTLYDYYNNIQGYELFHFSANAGFENMAKIYKIILLGKNVDFITLLLLSQILYFFIFIFMIYSLKINVNNKKFICFLLFFVFDVIFLAQPSKDQFSLLISIFVFRYIRSDKTYKNIYIITAILAYAYLFRSYYVLIVASYYFIKLIQISKKQIKILLIGALFIIIYYLFNSSNMLDAVINIRPELEGLLSDNTNTIIQNVIPYSFGEKNFLHFILNYFINLARIIFPIETLWESPSRGIFFVPLQLFVAYISFRYVRILKYKFTNCKVVSNIIIYIFSFIITQTLFEPDFGSVFRHSMNLMPFYLYLYFSLDYKKIYEEIKQNKILEKAQKEKHKKIKIVWQKI